MIISTVKYKLSQKIYIYIWLYEANYTLHVTKTDLVIL